MFLCLSGVPVPVCVCMCLCMHACVCVYVCVFVFMCVGKDRCNTSKCMYLLNLNQQMMTHMLT